MEKIAFFLLKDERVQKTVAVIAFGVLFLISIALEAMPKVSAGGKAGYIWPFDVNQYGPACQTITDYFGQRESPGGIGSTNHQGIDVSWGGCAGAEIRACKAGTIEIAGGYGGYGNAVRIAHDDGNQTLYAHCSEVLVSVGDTVKQGQVIALVGSTGNSTDPHLHLSAINSSGELFDPFELFPPSQHPDGKAAESSGGSIAKDPSEYHDEIIQGMNELGIEVTEDKVQRMIRQIATESGGDPNVVQGGPGSYVDINTFAPVADGWTCPWCPSSTGASCENYNRAHGLMQMIPTTFISNAQPGHENVFNSYDSILAALNYINRRYGGDFTQIGNGTGY